MTETPRLYRGVSARAQCLNPSVLFYCLLERLGGAELRRAGRVDVDGPAGAGIAALARGAGLRREDAESRDRDLVSGLQARDDAIDHALDSALGVCLGSTKNAVHLVDNICFIHSARC